MSVLQPRRSSLVLSLAIASTFAVVDRVSSQRPSGWAELTPPGGVDPSKLTFIPNTGITSKLVLYRDGEYLRVFSTVTGRWHGVGLSFGTSPVLTSEILLVPESDRWTAMSAYRGVFETQMVPFSTSRLTTSASFACVRDGANAYLFSAQTGRWHARTIPADWKLHLGERIARFTHPSSTTFGGAVWFDAMRSEWHTLGAQPATFTSAAQSASTLMWHFGGAPQGSYQITWSTHAPTPQTHTSPSFSPLFNQGGGGARGSDYVGFRDLTYCGTTQTLVAFGRDVSPQIDGFVAMAHDTVADTYSCLGAGATSYVTMPAGSQPLSTRSGRGVGVRLFGSSGTTIVYDGASHTTSTVTNDRGPIATGGFEGTIVAAVADSVTGRVDVYSTVTGRWHPLPTDALPEARIANYAPTPVATDTAVILATTTGVTAFSGRTGAFVPLNGNGLVRWSRNVVLEGTRVHVFDARTDRWRTHATPFASTPEIRISGSCVFAFDATQAFVYDDRSSTVGTIALTEPLVRTGVVDGGAFVATATRVFAFAGLPEVTTPHGFPEALVAPEPNTTFRFQVRTAPGDAMAVALSARTSTSVPAFGFGDLWLDPLSLIVLANAVTPAGESRSTFELPLPALPELRRTQWHVQSLVVPTAGAPYLTDFATMFVR